MKLSFAGSAGSSAAAEATEADIRKVFADDAGRGDFVILADSDQVFIQAAGEGDGPYTLEYRDGAEIRHFQSSRMVNKSTAEAAFLKYLARDASWKADFPWESLGQNPWWKFW